MKVVWKPVLKDSDSIRRLALEVNARDDVIGVIAWMHTFSPAKMWIAGLDALQKPLLHLHTQANVELPWADIDFDFMNLNQAAHGDREFGYIQTRLGVARKTVVGHVSNPVVRQQVEDWERAAAGWTASRTLKLARFGDNMRYVAVTEGDKTEAELRFGVQVNTWGVNELADAVAAASDADIDALVAEYVELYDVADELLPGAERHQSLRDGAAIELGLRSFLEEGGFGAFTTSFEDLGALKQLPGLAVQRLMAEGYGFGAEGDWKTAILVRVANVMGAGLPGGASLMEDYTYDLVPGNERILGAHMLEVSPSLTTSKPRLEVHALGIGGKEDPVRLVFTADPGPALVVAMSDMRDRFRLVANVVENVEAPDLPKLPGRPRDLEARARLRHERRMLAGRRRRPPHRHDHRGRHRGVPRLRRDRQDRARRHRRRHHGARVPERAALEPGILSTGPGLLTLPRAHLSHAHTPLRYSARAARGRLRSRHRERRGLPALAHLRRTRPHRALRRRRGAPVVSRRDARTLAEPHRRRPLHLRGSRSDRSPSPSRPGTTPCMGSAAGSTTRRSARARATSPSAPRSCRRRAIRGAS